MSYLYYWTVAIFTNDFLTLSRDHWEYDSAQIDADWTCVDICNEDNENVTASYWSDDADHVREIGSSRVVIIRRKLFW
jgi:Uri superfamily endonuclease